MRINSIRFQAIGPFPGEHFIDFDQLGDSALFLIDGPTGAGKSTIIDVITYAIYGEMAGSQSDAGRMRSMHAGPETSSWVELIFSNQNGTYKVRRAPSYLRAAKRGGGVTKADPSILVHEQLPNEEWNPLGFQWQSATRKLTEIVGLTRDQFAQTVILPQGEFANFLRASTATRQELLEKIFNTQLYKRVAEDLKEKSDSAKKVAVQKTQELLDEWHLTAGAAGIEEEKKNQLTDAIRSSDQGDAVTELLNQEVARLAEEYEKAAEASRLSLGAVVAKRAIKSTRDVELNAGLALDREKNNHKVASETLEATVQNLGRDHGTLLMQSGFSIPKNVVSAKQLGLEINRLLGSLESILTLESGCRELEAKRDSNKAKQSGLVAKSLELATRKSLIPEALLALKANLGELKTEANQVDLLGVKLGQARDDLLAAETCEQLEGKKSEAAVELEEANDAYQAIVKRYGEESKAWADNIAGVLAESLEDGNPCQVCGSIEHPAKAKLTSSFVSQAELTVTKSALDASHARVREIEMKLERYKGELESAGKAGVKAADAKEALVECETKLKYAQSAKAKVDKMQIQEQELHQELEKVNADAEALNGVLIALRTEMSVDERTLEVDSAKVESAKAGFASVKERQTWLDSISSELKEIDLANEALQQARGSLATAQAEYSKLAQHDFFGLVETAQSEVDIAESEYKVMQQVEVTAKTKRDAINLGSKKLDALLASRTASTSRNLDLLKLSAVAEGANILGTKLPAYVLQAMFEDVVAAANLRLGAILEGRYELRIASEDGARMGSRGLGLAVFDRLTESERSSTSLSGGEQFCASLSMALGLSDIVLSNNSGLSIDTFFIDEGFGSLDSDRLSQVMQMLDSLKTEGRTIGLISHVDEMKAAISERIDVTPAIAEGPSTLTVNWMS